MLIHVMLTVRLAHSKPRKQKPDTPLKLQMKKIKTMAGQEMARTSQ